MRGESGMKMVSRHKKVLFIVFGFVICASLSFKYLLLVFSEHERGLHLRNGEVISVDGPGLSWRAPIVDNIVYFSTKTNISELTAIHAHSSSDKYATSEFTVDASISWRVSPNEISNVYIRYGDEESIESAIIKPIASEVIGSVLSKYSGITLMETPELFIDDAKSAIRQSIGAIIEIDDVSVASIRLSELDGSALTDAEAGTPATSN